MHPLSCKPYCGSLNPKSQLFISQLNHLDHLSDIIFDLPLSKMDHSKLEIPGKFAGQREQANICVRRYGSIEVPYVGTVTPTARTKANV